MERVRASSLQFVPALCETTVREIHMRGHFRVYEAGDTRFSPSTFRIAAGRENVLSIPGLDDCVALHAKSNVVVTCKTKPIEQVLLVGWPLAVYVVVAILSGHGSRKEDQIAMRAE
jgi:hypothetical protein